MRAGGLVGWWAGGLVGWWATAGLQTKNLDFRGFDSSGFFVFVLHLLLYYLTCVCSCLSDVVVVVAWLKQILDFKGWNSPGL